MKKVCIYIEKYYFNEKFFLYVRRFLEDLDDSFDLHIYIPNIYVIKNIIKNKNIFDYLSNFFNIKKDLYDCKFDALIIFSDYDKGMYFDRREVIMDSIIYSKLIIINTSNFDINVNIYKNNYIQLLEKKDFCSRNTIISDSIFKTYKIKKKDNYFYNKYDINKTSIMLGFLYSLKINNFLRKIIKKLSKYFVILTIKNIGIENKNIIKIDEIDYIYIISYASEFYTDRFNLNFVYSTTCKPIMLIDDSNYFTLKKFRNNFKEKNNIVENLKLILSEIYIKSNYLIKLNDNKIFKR